jgi:hypothetical protein
VLDEIYAIDEALAEAEILLRSVVPGPGIRELLVRHGSLSRVVKGWGAAPPHEAQVAAMLECVTELLGSVKRLCALSPTNRPAFQRLQTARAIAAARKTNPPPPHHVDPRTRSTRPPPPRRRNSQAPPSQPPPSSRS